MDIYTNYKWQFLRRNKDYQSCYDFYVKFYKEEDSLVKEWFMEESCKKFRINKLLNYTEEVCESDIFEVENVIFQQLGPYSLNDLNGMEGDLFNLKYEFETSVHGKFEYLKSDEKNLVTLTIDISGPLTPNKKNNFFKIVEDLFEKRGTKNILKGYKDEKKLRSYLIAYDERYKNKSTYSVIYKKLQSQGLRPTRNVDEEAINAHVNQLLERANAIIERISDLDF